MSFQNLPFSDKWRISAPRRLQMLETCFVVHWLASSSAAAHGESSPSETHKSLQLEELLAAYDIILKSILQYIRILSDLCEDACFTLCFNGKTAFQRRLCRNFAAIVPLISAFKVTLCEADDAFSSFSSLFEVLHETPNTENSNRSVSGSQACDKSGLLVPSSVRLIVITNDAKFNWDVLQFQMLSTAFRAPLKIPFSLASIEDAFVVRVDVSGDSSADALHEMHVSGSSPSCKTIRSLFTHLQQNLQKLCILLNDLMVVKIANIPMKKTLDTTKTNYDVRFIFRRDNHVSGPSISAFYGKKSGSWSYFEEHREITFNWAKKHRIDSSGKVFCSHAATPLDLVDSPTAVIMETIIKGTDFALWVPGNTIPEHALIFRNNTLLFACYRYFDYDALYLKSGPQSSRYLPLYKTSTASFSKREIGFLDEVIAFISSKGSSNAKDYSVAEGHLKEIFVAYEHLNSSSFLNIDDLEPRMLFDIKECLVSMLSRQFSEKIAMAYLQGLLEYGKNDTTARPVFKFGTLNVKNKYLRLYLQISEYCALLKNISPFHSNLHIEFKKKVAAFQNDHFQKGQNAPLGNYLTAGITISADSEHMPASRNK